MEIITEQIRQEIAKEITRKTLEKCIEKIDKEIESLGCAVFQFYVNRLVRARNIIKEIKQEKS